MKEELYLNVDSGTGNVRPRDATDTYKGKTASTPLIATLIFTVTWLIRNANMLSSKMNSAPHLTNATWVLFANLIQILLPSVDARSITLSLQELVSNKLYHE